MLFGSAFLPTRPSDKGSKQGDASVDQPVVPLDDAQHPGLHAANKALEDILVLGDVLDAKQLIEGVIVVPCFGCPEAECVGRYLTDGRPSTPQRRSTKDLHGALCDSGSTFACALRVLWMCF